MAGILQQFAPKGNQSAAATQAGAIPGNQSAAATNFQSISGQKVAKPIYQAGQSLPVGIKAANPVVDNAAKPDNTIASTYQSSNAPIASNASTNYNPNANYNAGTTQQQPPAGTPVQQLSNLGTSTAGSSFNSSPGILNSLLAASNKNSAIGQSAVDTSNNYAKQIADVSNTFNNAATGDQSTGSVGVGGGNANLEYNALSNRINALSQAQDASLKGTAQQLTGQSQQQSGLLGALGLQTPANKFITTPYSNQILDANGNAVGGGSAGALPPQAQSFVNDIARQVRDGQMTRDEATSQLSAYGQPGLQALNSALGSGFNTNASNASATTTATGQQIQTAADSTNKALDTLASSFSSLNGLETGGIPLTNSIAQWIGSNLGDSALTQYKTNLLDARSQLIGVLSSSGGTPTDNESKANQYLPNDMTPRQFQHNVGTAQNPGIVRQLIAQKVGSFTTSGQQNINAQSNTNTGSSITWDSIVK